VSHNVHQKLLFAISLIGLRNYFDAFRDLLHENFDILDLLGGVVEQEVGVGFDPIVDGLLQLFDKRLGVYSEPSNVSGGLLLHLRNLVPYVAQVLDLLIKHIKGGESCHYIVQDL